MSTGSDSQTITFTTSEQDYSPANVSDIYGTMVFDERVMKERLPKATYKELMRTINDGEPLNLEVANVVAPRHEGMGHRTRCDPLHALVPTAFWRNEREA